MWKYTNGSVFVLFVMWTQLVVNIELVATNLIPPPAQPCDRTRRVFTEAYGEISDGPNGSNYTQVNILLNKLQKYHEWYTVETDGYLPITLCLYNT